MSNKLGQVLERKDAREIEVSTSICEKVGESNLLVILLHSFPRVLPKSAHARNEDPLEFPSPGSIGIGCLDLECNSLNVNLAPMPFL